VLATGFTFYYYNPLKHIGRQDKWSRKFSGPFLVVAFLGPINLKLQRSRRAKPFVTHVDKVKPYVAEKLPKPWIDERAARAEQPAVGDATKGDNRASTSMDAVAGMPPLQDYETPRPQRERRLPRRFME